MRVIKLYHKVLNFRQEHFFHLVLDFLELVSFFFPSANLWLSYPTGGESKGISCYQIVLLIAKLKTSIDHLFLSIVRPSKADF